jgi:hypothetical protein
LKKNWTAKLTPRGALFRGQPHYRRFKQKMEHSFPENIAEERNIPTQRKIRDQQKCHIRDTFLPRSISLRFRCKANTFFVFTSSRLAHILLNGNIFNEKLAL